jgi:hypothetical protein
MVTKLRKGWSRRTVVGAIAVAIMIIVIFSKQAQAAEAWKQKIIKFSATAGETLATGDIVCIAAADSYTYKADANDGNLRPAVGVIGKGGAAGAKVEIVVAGILAGQTAASPGARLFLSETAGAFTTTGPTNAQVIGWVLPTTDATATSTNYFVWIVGPSSGGAGY